MGYLVVATLFGEFVRNRRVMVKEYAERARHAEAEVEQRVTQERMRIARDLHDVLAHTVSGMTVQAGVALGALERDPGAAREALWCVAVAQRLQCAVGRRSWSPRREDLRSRRPRRRGKVPRSRWSVPERE